jgi:hypothetical protein
VEIREKKEEKDFDWWYETPLGILHSSFTPLISTLRSIDVDLPCGSQIRCGGPAKRGCPCTRTPIHLQKNAPPTMATTPPQTVIQNHHFQVHPQTGQETYPSHILCDRC